MCRAFRSPAAVGQGDLKKGLEARDKTIGLRDKLAADLEVSLALVAVRRLGWGAGGCLRVWCAEGRAGAGACGL